MLNPEELIDQAIKEKRVLLTRDAKLLRHEYLLKNQIYRVKSLLKNDQLNEVIETFQLNICEDQLMSRCTKCNGRFIQKPLSIEEAIEAAKGFQGTQYHNAVQKFIDKAYVEAFCSTAYERYLQSHRFTLLAVESESVSKL
nr:3'-5' exonuclease domain-containing protein [Tanacetum cinerariifolium]